MSRVGDGSPGADVLASSESIAICNPFGQSESEASTPTAVFDFSDLDLKKFSAKKDFHLEKGGKLTGLVGDVPVCLRAKTLNVSNNALSSLDDLGHFEGLSIVSVSSSVPCLLNLLARLNHFT